MLLLLFWQSLIFRAVFHIKHSSSFSVLRLYCIFFTSSKLNINWSYKTGSFKMLLRQLWLTFFTIFWCFTDQTIKRQFGKKRHTIIFSFHFKASFEVFECSCERPSSNFFVGSKQPLEHPWTKSSIWTKQLIISNLKILTKPRFLWDLYAGVIAMKMMT